MDLSLLGTAVISLIGPYLSKMAEKAAETAGERLVENTTPARLLEKVKSLFIVPENDEEKEITRKIELSQPISNTEIKIIENKINDQIKKDNAFAKSIEDALMISSTDEFIVTNILNSIKNKREQLSILYQDRENDDEFNRGKYNVRIGQKERALIEDERKLIQVLTTRIK